MDSVNRLAQPSSELPSSNLHTNYRWHRFVRSGPRSYLIPSMPNFGLRHSNRSQHQQLDSPQGQRPPSGHTQQTQPLAGPASASAEDKGFGARLQPQSYSDTHHDSEQQYIPTPIDGPSGGSPYGVGDHSASTESHRYSQLFGRPQQQYQQHPQDFDFDEDISNNPSQTPGIPGQLEKRSTVSVSKNLEIGRAHV